MKKNSQPTRIILYQNLGFLGIVFLLVFDELTSLPLLIATEHPFTLVHRQIIMELALVLSVWFLVSASTRRILQHLHYLEKFLRVCAWCRRINYQGEWMRLEEFMQQGFDTPTTHGICTECYQQQQVAIEKAKEARKNNLKPVA